MNTGGYHVDVIVLFLQLFWYFEIIYKVKQYNNKILYDQCDINQKERNMYQKEKYQ